MSLECYHYRYNNSETSDSTCQGTYEECRRSLRCPASDQNHQYHCFAAANVVSKTVSINGTITPTIEIFSAGCYPPHNTDPLTPCRKECVGTNQTSERYFCCCTGNLCNQSLRPLVVIPMPLPSATPNTTDPTHSKPPGSPSLLVIIFVLAVFASTYLAFIYFNKKPSRFKRKSSASNSLQIDEPQTRHDFHRSKVDNLNATELNDLRNDNDVAILAPFRDSFEGNNQQINNQIGRFRDHEGSNNNNLVDCFSNTRSGQSQRETISQQRNNSIEQHLIDLNDINLLEVVGSGRFGRVHRATLLVKCSSYVNGTYLQQQSQRKIRNLHNDGDTIEVISDNNQNDTRIQANVEIEGSRVSNGNNNNTNDNRQQKEIAVKVIATKERLSWNNELQIYCSTRTKHPNILDFFGWCESVHTNCHWLCIEYASRGSLHHFLKEHTVDWGELLKIALGTVRGLSHLHDSNVVHRDFKSKNVLLRHDLSPCITDFGVAAIMDIDVGSQQKKFLQVGTPRYMSPEILECTIVFGVKNFMKIDSYAAGLVIWELLTRLYPLPPLMGVVHRLMTATTAPNLELDGDNVSKKGNNTATSALLQMTNPDKQLDGQPGQELSNLSSGVESNHIGKSRPLALDNNDSEFDSSSSGGVIGTAMQQTSTPKLLTIHAGGQDELDPSMPQARQSPKISDMSCASGGPLNNNLERSMMQDSVYWQDNGPMPYKLPFEEYVGSDPDIDTMRALVCRERLRPSLRPEWSHHPIEPVSRSVRESWEYDEEARISATCFVERIERLYQEHQVQQSKIFGRQQQSATATGALNVSETAKATEEDTCNNNRRLTMTAATTTTSP